MLNMRLFLKSSIRPLSDLSIHLVGVLGSFVTSALQEPSYGHPYGRRHHTVHTVSHTAALKTVFSNPDVHRRHKLGWDRRLELSGKNGYVLPEDNRSSRRVALSRPETGKNVVLSGLNRPARPAAARSVSDRPGSVPAAHRPTKPKFDP